MHSLGTTLVNRYPFQFTAVTNHVTALSHVYRLYTSHRYALTSPLRRGNPPTHVAARLGRFIHSTPPYLAGRETWYKQGDDSSANSEDNNIPPDHPEPSTESSPPPPPPPRQTVALTRINEPPFRRPGHPFDSYKVVQRLKRGDFTHDQAVILMQALRALLLKHTLPVQESMVRPADLENASYLFKAALTELRTEISVLRQIDNAALRSEVEIVEHDLDALRHRMNEDMINLKSEIQIDVSQYKADQRERIRATEEAIQELSDKFTVSLGTIRTDMEGVKWETTRKGIMALYGGIAVISVFAIFFTQSSDPALDPATHSTGKNSEFDTTANSPVPHFGTTSTLHGANQISEFLAVSNSNRRNGQ
ncbi:hypothetical protein IWQ62_004263 [Dispira parvispora]|uniref:Uncharacterized protein n=1 Tax=Dispira parvispora TaxID=1520584 RepID=A0A9W8E0U5_9FUNG|nr:hypothetical protein IWQ62_004263 [Dispira parvispora]